MAAVIYAIFGQQPQNPVNQTARCGQCEPTFALVGIGNLKYDTERDARLTAQNQAFRDAIFAEIVPQLWKGLWNGFRCANAACGNKVPCGPRPTHLAIGAQTILDPPPAGVLRWQIMVGLAREIQCVKAAGTPDVDPPQIPDVEVLETPIFLASAPGPGPGGSGRTGEFAFAVRGAGRRGAKNGGAGRGFRKTRRRA
jgi:hypothetical protein